MEYNIWFLVALLTTFSIGITGFINKVFVEKKYNSEFVTMTFYVSLFMVSLFASVVFQNFYFSWPIVLAALLNSIIDYVFYRSRLKSLEFLSTSNYFINTRIFSSIGLLFIGIMFFNDNISFYEYLGFVLGFLVLYFLVKDDLGNNKNLKKGILFMGIGIIMVMSGHSNVKHSIVFGNALSFILCMTFFSALISLLAYYNGKRIEIKSEEFRSVLVLNIWQGFLYFLYYFFLFKTYSLGDLAISYKVMSYSPFIPIVFSVFMFKEKITKNQIIALIIASISLWFFTI